MRQATSAWAQRVFVSATLLVLTLLANPALAQQEVSKVREGNAWIGYVVAVVLVLLVALVSFLGTKRSHEDT